MSSTKFYRITGMSLIIAAVLAISNYIQELLEASDTRIFLDVVVTAENIVSSLFLDQRDRISFIGTIFYIFLFILVIVHALSLCGVWGLYRYKARQVGILGLFGFLPLFLCFLAGTVVLVYMYASIKPTINVASYFLTPAYRIYIRYSFIYNCLLALGSIVFGIAVLRARVFSRTAGILLLVGGILNAVATPTATPLWPTVSLSAGIAIFGIILTYIGFALMGYTLFTQASTDRVKTASLSATPPF